MLGPHPQLRVDLSAARNPYAQVSADRIDPGAHTYGARLACRSS
jgi:hypothetical protein